MNDAANEITGMDAVTLRAMIAGRHLSCREVMQAYLSRIEAINPAVTALVALIGADTALAQADEADMLLKRNGPSGPLHGFPQAPKDLADARGIISTGGSPLFKDRWPTQDALVVERARRAGAIMIGKTNVPEFGLGSQSYNRVYGTTRNAWDPKLAAGGSSGGAAVALAHHLLPVADGSDMMGSLRNPAGWNNVVGFRPSFGLVPMWPSDDVFYQQLAYEGPMGRTVADAALLLSVQAGSDDRIPLSVSLPGVNFAAPLDRDFAHARIGFLGDLDGHLAMEDGVLDVCRAALGHFDALDCKVDDAAIPFDMARLWDAWCVLRHALVDARIGALYDDPSSRKQLKPEAIWEVECARQLDAARFLAASATRSAWYQAMRAVFEQYDYLILPTAQTFAFDASLHWPAEVGGKTMDTYHRWMEVTVPASLAGIPALAVPAGFDAKGRAMGIQIMGPRFADMAVLQLGHAYEQVTRFSSKRPVPPKKPGAEGPSAAV